MQIEDNEDTKSGKFARLFCTVSIAAMSTAIVHNAIFAQQSRVFSESRISISADSTRLDKLFSVLNVKDDTVQQGHTRVSVQPGQAETTPAPVAPVDKAVLDVQQKLTALGTYAGQVTGVLDQDTRDAIMRYQRQNALALTGKPDSQFVEHLEYIYQIHQASTATSSIEPGLDRQSVERAQRQLRKLGYDPGPIDGQLGAKTLEAIRLYQADARLAPDGRLTPELLDRLAPAKTTQVE